MTKELVGLLFWVWVMPIDVTALVLQKQRLISTRRRFQIELCVDAIYLGMTVKVHWTFAIIIWTIIVFFDLILVFFSKDDDDDENKKRRLKSKAKSWIPKPVITRKAAYVDN